MAVTPAAPFDGLGDDGATGGGSAGGTVGGAVENVQTGPDVVAASLRAMTCQKYVVALASRAGAYDGVDIPCKASGGGFVVPKNTS